MDQDNVSAVRDWSPLGTIKELQKCLGFANFYQRFIQNYSSVASPLTSLLKGTPRRMKWNPLVDNAFNRLKKAFTTAPILQHTDPEKPFVVEVDASDVGVGAILSQLMGEKKKLHSIAFFAKKLSLAEHNYDVFTMAGRL